MRERIKSVVLLALVLLSFYLTGTLLFGQPYLETATSPDYEQVETFGMIRPEGEQVYPVLRLKTEENWLQLFPWTERYAPVWKALQFLLTPSQLPESGEKPDFSGKRVEIQFPVAVDAALWFQESLVSSLQIRKVCWFAEDAESIWYCDEGGKWWQAKGFNPPAEWETRLAALFKQAPVYIEADMEILAPFTAGDAIVLLPADLPVMSVFTAMAESLDTEKLLRSFFINPALVRRIEERNGAVIYTDGQRGLRIFAHGELEITVPENEPGTRALSRTEILQETAQYLHLLGGWPQELFLQSIRVNVQSITYPQRWYTQEVVFRCAARGYPLVGRKAPLSLLFSDRGIIYYNRQILSLAERLTEPMPLVAPEDALASVAVNMGIWAAGMQLASVDAIYFVDGATGSQPVAQPAWLIQFQNRQAAVVNGFTGELITWLQ
ncbi:MAG: hypothetical protein GX167_04230 [Firmicutes bacterium]|jgi:hypothetical protein|nr:hypothetical protein [Bacillota bacterium]